MNRAANFAVVAVGVLLSLAVRAEERVMKRASKIFGLLLWLAVLLTPSIIYAEVLKISVSVKSFHDGLAIVNIYEQHDANDPQKWVSKTGAIDRNGQWVIRPNSDISFNEFSEDLAPAVSNQKWGYINHAGLWVVDPQYESASNFSEGLASVKLNSRYGIIDHNGAWAITPGADDIGPFYERLAIARLGSRYGYINYDGNWVLSAEGTGLSDLGEFRDGLARAKMNSKWGYIDHKGNWAIPPKFDEHLRPGSFNEGLAFAQITEDGVSLMCGYIDHFGKWIIGPQFENAGDFSDGLALAKMGGKYGYIDHKGKWVIKPQFVSADDFSEGLARVGIPDNVKNQYGGHDTHAAFIDRKGKVMITTEQLKALVKPYAALSEFDL